MWDYTEKVLDHFRNPRNVGKIDDPDGVGTVGSLACGDALTLMFKLDGEGRIAEVKFQTFGCASAIASSSALTEMVLGKTVDEAAKITNQQIAAYLGGLPEQKMHCSVMGREALEAAIHNYRTGETAVRNLSEEKIICACFGVAENEVLRVVRENSLTTVEQITHYCKAGGGCGQCKPELQALLDQVMAERTALKEAPAGGKKLTNLQRIQLIQDVIVREIRPALRKDQGDIELVDIDGRRVTIAFRGMCAGCQSAEITRKDFIQAKLREFVASDIEVVEEGK
ncbi:MAG: Fe-S cluster assembly protein NifU [Kiritimatiellae bacterium]|nr:Fe-S cluster assembly protein NifU [Kiritimatiellia bacterium]